MNYKITDIAFDISSFYQSTHKADPSKAEPQELEEMLNWFRGDVTNIKTRLTQLKSKVPSIIEAKRDLLNIIETTNVSTLFDLRNVAEKLVIRANAAVPKKIGDIDIHREMIRRQMPRVK